MPRPHGFSRLCSHAKSVSSGMSQRFLVLLHVPFSMPVLFNVRCKYYLGRFWQYGNKIKIDCIIKLIFRPMFFAVFFFFLCLTVYLDFVRINRLLLLIPFNNCTSN